MEILPEPEIEVIKKGRGRPRIEKIETNEPLKKSLTASEKKCYAVHSIAPRPLGNFPVAFFILN
jgi:hypothetical protein